MPEQTLVCYNESIIRTRDRRPDMYAKLDLSSKADQKLLKEIAQEEAEQNKSEEQT